MALSLDLQKVDLTSIGWIMIFLDINWFVTILVNQIVLPTRLMVKMFQYQHFGILLEWNEFDNFSQQIIKENDIKFMIEPYLRFEGLPGEQSTIFLKTLLETPLSLSYSKKIVIYFSKEL